MRIAGPGGILLTLVVGAVAGPLTTNVAAAAGLEASAWAITPDDSACHTDFELVARSGGVAPVALVSDGERVLLRFTKEGVPTLAFLPIRIDRKPYANLVQRTGDEGLAVMGLSDETLDAMRHGRVLQIAWLSDEALSASLSGAAQGIADLKTCGAQVAGQHRAQARAQAAARASAAAEEQLTIARTQAAAAEAVRQRAAAEAEELTARAEKDRAMATAERQRVLANRERQRALAAQQYYYGDRQPAPQPQPVPWGYYRSYDYPR